MPDQAKHSYLVDQLTWAKHLRSEAKVVQQTYGELFIRKSFELISEIRSNFDRRSAAMFDRRTAAQVASPVTDHMPAAQGRRDQAGLDAWQATSKGRRRYQGDRRTIGPMVQASFR